MLHNRKSFHKDERKNAIIWMLIFLQFCYCSVSLLISNKIHQGSMVSKLGETYTNLEYSSGDTTKFLSVMVVVLIVAILIDGILMRVHIKISERNYKRRYMLCYIYANIIY